MDDRTRPTAWSILCLAVIFFGLFGCEQKMEENVAAMVHDRIILKDSVEDRMRSWNPDSPLPPIESDLGKRALDELIQEALVLQEAERLGIEISQEEFDRQVEGIQADYPGRSFQDMLVREFIDYEGWKVRIRTNLLIEKTTRAILADRVVFSIEEWTRFFSNYGKVNPEPGQVLVRHISIRSCERVRRMVEEIRSGLDFETVAGRLYDDESKMEGARPVWVFPDLLPESIAGAIVNTRVGELSEVVETEFGCSVFLILDSQAPPESDPKIEMAVLRQRFLEERKHREFEAWMNEVRSRTRISINPALASQWRPEATNR